MALPLRPRQAVDGERSAGNVRTANIGAWNEQTAQPLNRVSITTPSGVRGTTVTLAIDLDDHSHRNADRDPEPAATPPQSRRKLIRRDSLDRREALLKGKEGSRRRTRWENDRLLSNPWAQPPLPTDWEVHPTYPRHTVPYYLATLWDQGFAARAEARRAEQVAARKVGLDDDGSQSKIPKELRDKLKKTKAAKGLLKDLEEQVRLFLQRCEGNHVPQQSPPDDSEDEEIVFIGRNGRMTNEAPSPTFDDSDDEDESLMGQLVFESLASDQGASFGRWLVHSIATYYGLDTWSETAGNPARRKAYVGISAERSRLKSLPNALPTPLWVMV